MAASCYSLKFQITLNSIKTHEKKIVVELSLDDPCAMLPCKNGATCQPLSDEDLTYVCDCAAGFSGRQCQISTLITGCSKINCMNGGTCFNSLDGLGFCTCPNGYTGTFCQKCKRKNNLDFYDQNSVEINLLYIDIECK